MAAINYRNLEPGMGEAVASRTILRTEYGVKEDWGDVAHRVADGNTALVDDFDPKEYGNLRDHIAQARLLMSGRHLQHGDAQQKNRNMEVFTNCGHYDTEFITLEHGVAKLGELVGEDVTVRAEDGVWRSAVVKEYGEQEMFRLTFHRTGSGPNIVQEGVFTRNHRWILEDGSVTDHIQIGDVLKRAPVEDTLDDHAVIHGLVFGDGSAHKRRRDNKKMTASQGRTYASLRVCAQDTVRDEIIDRLDRAGYHATTPASANGDPVYYIGKFPFSKEVPFSTDPEYIAGFIHGWWLADGSKTLPSGTLEISTVLGDAAEWLKKHAAYAGMTVVGHTVRERKSGDGSYPNGKPLHTVRLQKDASYRLAKVEPLGSDTAYCVEEPVTQSFVLANGLLTGNCSTAMASFIKFYLLLNGSGVGRLYDDSLMLVNWDYMPEIVPVLSHTHRDRDDATHMDGTPFMAAETAKKVFRDNAHWFTVPDSREGWAKAVELIERMAYERTSKWDYLVMDFSEVRPRGEPIGGMQDRPASGPVPLMQAFMEMFAVKGQGMEPWEQTFRIDHALAACVAVGGARRAARIALKNYSDPGIFKFIKIKQESGLWTANNSIVVDAEFWQEAIHEEDSHERAVLDAALEAQYEHGTGEPGFLNVDRLNQNEEGLDKHTAMNFFDGYKYEVEMRTIKGFLTDTFKAVGRLKYKFIVNPCVTEDTWVETSDGPKQVADLIDTPFRAVVDGQEYEATGFWQTGVKQVLRIKTDRGYQLRLTDNHKMLVKRPLSDCEIREGGQEYVWVEAGDLVEGDRLVLNDHRDYARIDHSNPSFGEGWLLGSMVGDGGYNPDKYAGYVRFWGPMRKPLSELAENYFQTIKHDARVDHGGARQENGHNGTIELASRALDVLAEGLIEPGTKSLLPALEKKGTMFVVGFLAGLFDADGSVQGNKEKGVSVRLAQSGDVGMERLRAVQRMLLRLGMASTIYENRRDAGARELPDGNGGMKEYECQAQHELVISKDNLQVYLDVVGFMDGGKEQTLADVLAEYTRGPYGEDFTAKVTAVVEDGTEPVYDCTVDYAHCFDANGLTAHNCGEIVLFVGGGYCVIADVVPFYADDLEQARDAFLTATRALIRTNTMSSLYDAEVKRTNRIGVGMTGIQEFAWKHFGLAFRDLIADFDFLVAMPEGRLPVLPFSQHRKAWEFWMWLRETRGAVEREADRYSDELGVSRPHTVTTIKPAGTTSKLFILSEGAHLPSMEEFLRWVQFQSDDPIVREYEELGYPVRRNIKNANGDHVADAIVGFPTQPQICRLDIPRDRLVTSGEVTMEEQFKWVRLLEKFWLGPRGNQISYTLKYDRDHVSAGQYREMILKHMPEVRAVSVMPISDWKETKEIYGYVPEEPVKKEKFDAIVSRILERADETISLEDIACESGACPI